MPIKTFNNTIIFTGTFQMTILGNVLLVVDEDNIWWFDADEILQTGVGVQKWEIDEDKCFCSEPLQTYGTKKHGIKKHNINNRYAIATIITYRDLIRGSNVQ